VSFLHDVNGLNLLRTAELRPPLTVSRSLHLCHWHVLCPREGHRIRSLHPAKEEPRSHPLRHTRHTAALHCYPAMLMYEAARRTRLNMPWDAHRALQVVLVNNGGGGIFSFLPVAGEVPDDTFTALWATPQHVDLMGAHLRACPCHQQLCPADSHRLTCHGRRMLVSGLNWKHDPPNNMCLAVKRVSAQNW